MTNSPDVDDRLPEWLHEQLTSEPLVPLRGDLAQRVASRVTRRRQATVAVAAVLVAVAVAVPAILSGSPSSSPATSTHTPSVTPSTATTPTWTLAQACDYWRAGAAPVVKAFEARREVGLRQAVDAATWRTVRDTFGPYGAASRTFAHHLQSPPQPWPTPLASSAPPTAAFWLSMATWADKVARAKTEAEFNRLYRQDPSLHLPVAYQLAGDATEKACGGGQGLPSP